MIKIAICDDEAIYRENTEKECKKYFQEKSEEILIDFFMSGKELLETERGYDILFLDIEMPDSDGIRVKEFFENNKKETRIIFLTSHEERALEAFGKNVLSFLRKPLKVQEFRKALDRVLTDIQGATLEIEENGELIILQIRQIKYVEAQDKYTTVVTKAGSHMFRKTMKFWEEQLPRQDFGRIHKSFLVNFEFFVKDKEEVILEKNKRVKISRRNKAEVMEQYGEYLRRKAVMM